MNPPAGARRFVVPSVTPPAVRSIVDRLVQAWGLSAVESPVVGDELVVARQAGDLAVHSVPDVFGRRVEPPSDWNFLEVVDRASGVAVAHHGVGYGRVPTETASQMAGRLRELWKPLIQQRGVRPVLAGPAPFGLAFVAPDGIDAPDDVTATSVEWNGIPDLVLVHYRSLSTWEAYDGDIESPEWK